MMVDNHINNTNRIFGFDVMRATAIGMVLCSHILWIYPDSSGLITELFALFGYWGVEIFFVLSGFLIGTILYNAYLKDNFTSHAVFYFLKRRWYRTLPNYFLVLVLNIIIALVIGVSIADIGYYFLFLQNFCTTMKPFFTESWSLSVEEFAYVFTPFALVGSTFFAKPKNKSNRFITVVLCLISLFMINKIIYNFTTLNTDLIQWSLSLKSVVIYRIDSILIGIAFSWISIKHQDFWKKQKMNFFFLGSILIVIMFFGVGFWGILIEKYPTFWNVFYLPITSITFAFFLPVFSQWKSAPNWFLKPVTLLSLISYSVYLLHYGIVLQLMKYYIDTTSFAAYQLHIFTLVYLAVTFFLSFLLYKYFEKPIMDLRNALKKY